SKLIQSHRRNLLEEDTKLWCQNLTTFIGQNLNYTAGRVRKNPFNPYWQQVGLALYQLAGLDDGYALAQGKLDAKSSPHLTVNPCGLIPVNLHTEMGDTHTALNHTLLEPKTSHCSAIIKLLPQSNDVLVAHSTRTSYKSMLRIMKRYTLTFS